MSGDGPAAASCRTFLKPASSSQRLMSLKPKVSPRSLCRFDLFLAPGFLWHIALPALNHNINN
jgi:hypothetical protein